MAQTILSEDVTRVRRIWDRDLEMTEDRKYFAVGVLPHSCREVNATYVMQAD